MCQIVVGRKCGGLSVLYCETCLSIRINMIQPFCNPRPFENFLVSQGSSGQCQLASAGFTALFKCRTHSSIAASPELARLSTQKIKIYLDDVEVEQLKARRFPLWTTDPGSIGNPYQQRPLIWQNFVTQPILL